MTLEKLTGVGILLGTAAIMGIGFRIGGDLYNWVAMKVLTRRSEKLLDDVGLEKLREEDPLRA